MVGGAAFSLRQGAKYPEAVFKDSNKKWAEEWFVVAYPAPGLPPRTGLPPILNARSEEKPTEEEMVEVEVLLFELQKLKADKLTGVVVALSFAKRVTQPIQEHVHPCYEYSGHDDPIHGQNHKVYHSEAYRRVMLIVSGEVRDKGCPKAHCLK
ncbi:putative gypsy-type retrotransposon [Panicum miliaceum]|uniref:Gypsy-type retrotransposon n=1 Tax=Panicum miliaceum TaxID=4540 RepID=A0A3L6TAD3_PANMI|nr:putative gypsy-type retrotransposon [Panicum miliaceum]